MTASDGSSPTVASSITARSATLRASGPPMSWLCDSGMMPVRLDRPAVPRSPNKLLFAAGIRIDPQVSLAIPATAKLAATAAAVAERSGLANWTTAWQSAARTPEPWLTPDILSVIDETDPGSALLVCPCGFVADHLEVLYDLDVQAAQRAAGRGITFARTASVNDDPAVMDALAARLVDALR